MLLVVFLPPLLAWASDFAFGLPATAGNADPANPRGPHQFPFWIRGWHYLNLLFVVLLVPSGWKILRAAPRLYWIRSATTGAEWLRIGPASAGTVPDQPTSLRYWHAVVAVGWAVSGWVYVVLLGLTGAWTHLVPSSRWVVREAGRVFVQYSTFHLPLDPDGFYRYNSLQLLSYFTVMFGFVPLIALSGLAISPAFGGSFARLAGLFGNPQAARSIHYLAILAYLLFIAIHVTFVVMYALWLNWNHVVLGTDETGLPGGVIAAAGVGGIALVVWLTRRFR